MKKYIAYHFSNYTNTLGHGDGRKIVLGETLSVDGEPNLCNYGLHGSESILDALSYAVGPNLWLTEIWGDVQISDKKLCGKNRKTLKQYGNVLPLIIEFASWCANRAQQHAAKAVTKRAAEYAKRAAESEKELQIQWWNERLSQLLGE